MITLPVDTILRGLGIAATYTKGTAKSIRGIFIKPYQSVDIGGMIVQNAAPSLAVSTAAVTGVDRTATVAVSSVTYSVTESRDLGNGFTLLILTKA